MDGAMTRLGPWHLVRTVGRDLSGVYLAARRASGDCATLYLPSGELARSGGGSLLRLAARLSHRAIVQVFDLISHDDVDHMVI